MKENQFNPNVGQEQVNNQSNKQQEQTVQQQAPQQYHQPYGYPYPPRPRMPRPMYPNPYYGYPHPMQNPQARPMQYPYGPQYPNSYQGYAQPQPVQQQPVQQPQPNISVNVVPAGYVPSAININQAPQQVPVVEKAVVQQEVVPAYPKTKKEKKLERKAAIKAQKEFEKEELRKDKLFAKGKYPERVSSRKTKKSLPRRLFKLFIILLVVFVILAILILGFTPFLLKNETTAEFLLNHADWLYEFLHDTYEIVYKWVSSVTKAIGKYAKLD